MLFSAFLYLWDLIVKKIKKFKTSLLTSFILLLQKTIYRIHLTDPWTLLTVSTVSICGRTGKPIDCSTCRKKVIQNRPIYSIFEKYFWPKLPSYRSQSASWFAKPINWLFCFWIVGTVVANRLRKQITRKRD